MVSVPVITSNRINTPQLAEACLQNGDADLVSMARPFLADGEFVQKAVNNQPQLINRCIACNQACLDHVFSGRRASCLVNPRACHEDSYPLTRVKQPKNIVIIGLGVAGLSCAYHAALRGHRVTAYEAGVPGGQFNLAAEIPGKQEYADTVAWFMAQLESLQVAIQCHHKVDMAGLTDMQADAIVFATGVTPRKPAIPGIDHGSVMDYERAIKNRAALGKTIAIIGAGGIGFDIAEMLVTPPMNETGEDYAAYWYEKWGVDTRYRQRGGLLAKPLPRESGRTVYLLQRKREKPGKHLARSTGWIRRLSLRQAGVHMLSGITYEYIDNAGLHIICQGKQQALAVEQIIVCAGQESRNDLYQQMKKSGRPVYIIGGAKQAAELNAEKAIREGMELAYSL